MTALLAVTVSPASADSTGAVPASNFNTPLTPPQPCGGEHFLVRYGNYKYEQVLNQGDVGGVALTASKTARVLISSPDTGATGYGFEGPLGNYPFGTTCANAATQLGQPIGGFTLQMQGNPGTPAFNCRGTGTYRRGGPTQTNDADTSDDGNNLEFRFPTITAAPGTTCPVTSAVFTLRLVTTPGNQDQDGRDVPVVGNVNAFPYTACDRPIMPNHCFSVGRYPASNPSSATNIDFTP